MARVQGMFSFSGKIGDKVYRVINGKGYVANAPTHYTLSQTPEAILRREKFKLCRKLCSAINQLFYSKMLWRADTPKKVHRLGYLMKAICSKIEGYNISGKILIPHPDFSSECISSSFENDTIKLRFAPLGFDQKIFINPDTVIGAEGFLYLCDPGSQKKDKFNLIPLISEDRLLILNQEIEINFVLTGLQLDTISLYPEKKLYAALIIKNTQSEKTKDLYCRASDTFNLEIGSTLFN